MLYLWDFVAIVVLFFGYIIYKYNQRKQFKKRIKMVLADFQAQLDSINNSLVMVANNLNVMTTNMANMTTKMNDLNTEINGTLPSADAATLLASLTDVANKLAQLAAMPPAQA